MTDREYPADWYSLNAATRNFVRRAVAAMGQSPLEEDVVEQVALNIIKQFTFLNKKPAGAKSRCRP